MVVARRGIADRECPSPDQQPDPRQHQKASNDERDNPASLHGNLLAGCDTSIQPRRKQEGMGQRSPAGQRTTGTTRTLPACALEPTRRAPGMLAQTLR